MTEDRILAATFERLLTGHSLILARSRRPDVSITEMYERLLDGFLEEHDRCVADYRRRTRLDLSTLRRLLDGFEPALEKWRKHQEDLAEDFNVLEVLELTGDEKRHSMILAWLLDHDIMRFGTHSQGRLGFRLFLAEIGLPLAYAEERYWVRREVSGEDARVDIEVAARQRFLVHIEAKVWSKEGQDQTDREWDDMRRRRMELGIPLKTGPNCVLHGLFLTPILCRSRGGRLPGYLTGSPNRLSRRR